jgi:hypothetical protein
MISFHHETQPVPAEPCIELVIALISMFLSPAHSRGQLQALHGQCHGRGDHERMLIVPALE